MKWLFGFDDIMLVIAGSHQYHVKLVVDNPHKTPQALVSSALSMYLKQIFYFLFIYFIIIYLGGGMILYYNKTYME